MSLPPLHNRFMLWGLMLALLLSCNQNKVSLTTVSPEGEVSELETFTFEFSEDLAPADKWDQWLDEPFVEFEPTIEGRFKWLGARTLIFSPEKPLLPSQDYTARVKSKSVLFGKALKGDFDKIRFNTPHLNLEQVELFWKRIPRADYTLSVQANLTFTYPISPEELREHLKIEQDNKTIKDIEIASEGPDKVIAINFGQIKQSTSQQSFTITVQKGLNSVIGKAPLAETQTFSRSLPAITRLAISNVNSGFSDDGGWVEIHTTQQVDERQVKKFVSLSPKPRNLKFEVMEDRVRLSGGLKAGTTVALKVDKGLPGLYGGTLEDVYTENLILADLEPRLRFADKMGTYLLRGGEQNISVEGTNVPEARLEVYEVFKNNLIFFFHNNYGYQSRYINNYGDDDYGAEYDVSYYGKQLFSDKLAFPEGRNRKTSMPVNLDSVVSPRFKGIYMVQVRSNNDYWVRDAKLVAISDIGLIAKMGPDELTVFANSIETAEPAEGVEVKLISETNQTLVSGKTDATGKVQFDDLQAAKGDFNPRMLVAEKGDDFNFIDLRATQVENSRADVGGKYIAPDAYDAFLYGDRNLYRPGERAYISGILRTPSFDPVQGEPMLLKVIDPRGREVETFKISLDREGAFEQRFELAESAPTGGYTADLYTGSDRYLAGYRFYVEAFAPDRIRVNAQADKEFLKGGENLQIDVSSEYLFGAPAADHRYEMDVNLQHRPFYSKKFPQFNFSNTSFRNSGLDNAFFEGKLDASGEAKIAYTFPSQVRSGGYIQGNAYISVFDVTGRTVNQAVPFKAYPKKVFLGVASKGYYYGTNKDLTFKMVATGPDDQDPGRVEAEVELIRYEWKTVLERNNYSGRYAYRSVKKEISEWKRDITLGQTPSDFKFSVKTSGRHELRIRKKSESEYVRQSFYAYRWGNATASSFEIDKEGAVEIVLDKEQYAPGERAKALFVSPFTGKMLVTLERDKVYQHWFVDLEKNSQEMEIPIAAEHLPNIYLTATVFRPHNGDQSAPFLVGHGIASITVNEPDRKLAVSIEAPERVKPRTTQQIKVKTGLSGTVQVTLAAVDEGILQIKNYKTPDPYNHMYAKRRLSVSSHDIYEFLLPEIVSSNSSPAGGDEAAARRLNPVKNERFKLLATWSGILKTNSQGEVTVPIELPQYNGEVRLMAIAYQGKRFGSAERAMKVSDDVIILPSVPRFLSPGDKIKIPVSVMNTTDKAGKVTVQMAVNNTLKVNSANSQSLNVAAKGTSQTIFEVEAPAVGEADITFTTSGLDNVTENIKLPVRPAVPYTVSQEGGSIKAGQTLSLDVGGEFYPGTLRQSLTVSAFPAVQFAHHLRYLVGYPHGCLEQTTSRLFPQLYFNDLAALAAPDMYKRGNASYYIREGIRKLAGMQRYDGSFNYWSGGNYVSEWGSVYATHFLIEARKAGYDVDDGVMTKSLNYLAKLVTEKETFRYDYFSGSWKTKTLARKEILYGLYVLALADKADIATMNYYRGRTSMLSSDSRYLLAGAYAHANNYTVYHELIPRDFEAEICRRESGYTFDSEARANALKLNVLLDVDPSNTQIPQLITYLSKLGNKIYSTQDRSWVFLALGKGAQRAKNSNVQLTIKSGNKTVAKVSDREDRISLAADLSGTLTIEATGEGETFYFLETEGIPANNAVTEVDEKISIRRTYYTRFGNPAAEIKQGDLIVCELALTGGDQSVQNILISDLVPAGFEIDNPRLNPSADLSWIKEKKGRFTPDYLDVRDDRLLIFTNAQANNTKRFFYMLRAVNSGTFVLPAVGAEALYDPAYRSYNGAGTLQILPME